MKLSRASGVIVCPLTGHGHHAALITGARRKRSRPDPDDPEKVRHEILVGVRCPQSSGIRFVSGKKSVRSL